MSTCLQIWDTGFGSRAPAQVLPIYPRVSVGGDRLSTRRDHPCRASGGVLDSADVLEVPHGEHTLSGIASCARANERCSQQTFEVGSTGRPIRTRSCPRSAEAPRDATRKSSREILGGGGRSGLSKPDRNGGRHFSLVLCTVCVGQNARTGSALILHLNIPPAT